MYIVSLYFTVFDLITVLLVVQCFFLLHLIECKCQRSINPVWMPYSDSLLHFYNCHPFR